MSKLITVSRLFYPRTFPRGQSVPFIRLCGRWLAHAGFHSGARLRVTVAQKSITLEIAE